LVAAVIASMPCHGLFNFTAADGLPPRLRFRHCRAHADNLPLCSQDCRWHGYARVDHQATFWRDWS